MGVPLPCPLHSRDGSVGVKIIQCPILCKGKTGCGAFPAAYPVGTGVVSPEGWCPETVSVRAGVQTPSEPYSLLCVNRPRPHGCVAIGLSCQAWRPKATLGEARTVLSASYFSGVRSFLPFTPILLSPLFSAPCSGSLAADCLVLFESQ